MDSNKLALLGSVVDMMMVVCICFARGFVWLLDGLSTRTLSCRQSSDNRKRWWQTNAKRRREDPSFWDGCFVTKFDKSWSRKPSDVRQESSIFSVTSCLVNYLHEHSESSASCWNSSESQLPKRQISYHTLRHTSHMSTNKYTNNSATTAPYIREGGSTCSPKTRSSRHYILLVHIHQPPTFQQ